MVEPISDKDLQVIRDNIQRMREADGTWVDQEAWDGVLARLDAAEAQCEHNVDAMELVQDENNSLARRNRAFLAALNKIQNWEMPETGRFWDNDPTRPMSYAACYGSNGERDFIRSIARQALEGK